jgi:hypothetical protein
VGTINTSVMGGEGEPEGRGGDGAVSVLRGEGRARARHGANDASRWRKR